MSSIQEIFSKNLKTIRKEKKLSQQAIAEKSDMLASTFNRIENMKVVPSIETVERIAKAMHIEFVDLFQSRELKDQSLVKKLQIIDNLSEYNKKVVDILFDSIIEKDKLEKAKEIKVKQRLEELKNLRKS
jgi:transcriptional regulator with XRE-family HTH domain